MDSMPEMDSSNSENTNRFSNTISNTTTTTTMSIGTSSSSPSSSSTPSRYENQKRRDWNTFGQYLKNHRPPLSLSRCSGAHVLEFLRYLDQFGKTKVHTPICPFYGHPNPPAPCPCPLRQAWGSLDALIGRLRAAFEENGGKPESGDTFESAFDANSDSSSSSCSSSSSSSVTCSGSSGTTKKWWKK
eukprot:XP_015582608.1 protein LIGHT-DEPENDENT SHORT HYPOCOTYLS 3 [Ricinus communis]